MSELIEAGLSVTGIGMSVVFVLLTAMVGIVRVMSRLSAFLERSGSSVMPEQSSTPAPLDDAELVGVVGAAVQAYRNRHRN